MNIYERVRKQQAAAEKARKAAEYKAGESERRSAAGRYAAAVRADQRIDAIVDGRAQPRNFREQLIADRAEFGV